MDPPDTKPTEQEVDTRMTAHAGRTHFLIDNYSAQHFARTDLEETLMEPVIGQDERVGNVHITITQRQLDQPINSK
jgi:hypothetical protein